MTRCGATHGSARPRGGVVARAGIGTPGRRAFVGRGRSLRGSAPLEEQVGGRRALVRPPTAAADDSRTSQQDQDSAARQGPETPGVTGALRRRRFLLHLVVSLPCHDLATARGFPANLAGRHRHAAATEDRFAREADTKYEQSEPSDQAEDPLLQVALPQESSAVQPWCHTSQSLVRYPKLGSSLRPDESHCRYFAPEGRTGSRPTGRSFQLVAFEKGALGTSFRNCTATKTMPPRPSGPPGRWGGRSVPVTEDCRRPGARPIRSDRADHGTHPSPRSG